MGTANFSGGQLRYPGGVGYEVRFFEIGSTTIPISSYSDREGTEPNPWPVILGDDGSGDGVALLFLDRDATIQIWTAEGAEVPGSPYDWLKPITGSDLEAIDKEVADRLAGHDADIRLLQSRATLLETRSTAVEGRASALEARVNTAEANIVILNDDAEDLYSQMGTARTDIATLQGQMTTTRSDIGILNDDAENLFSRMATAEGEIDTLQGQMTAAQTGISNLNDDAEDLLSRMPTAEGEIDTLQGQMSTVQTGIATLSDEVAALQTLTTGMVAESGGSEYVWNKESDTLICWGDFTTASSGNGSITFPVEFDVSPSVIPTTIWSGSGFTAVKVKTRTTTGFTVYAAFIGSDGIFPEAIAGDWIAIGKKYG